MVFVVKTLVTICLAIVGVASIYAQLCPPLQPDTQQLPLSECRMIANGKGRYWEKDDAISASISLYLLGKRGDVVSAPSGDVSAPYGIRFNNDVLHLSISYYAPRKIIPMTVGLHLTSHSKIPSKYKENHKLTIYVDDKPILSEDMDVGPSIVIAEQFSFQMKYTDFLKFTEAKQITIQLGETQIKLKSEDIMALNELNKTTKELKPPPFSSWM